MSNEIVEVKHSHIPSLETDYVFEWTLPGSGEEGIDCGSIYYFAHEDHWTSKMHWCKAFECPKCYEHSWLPSEASAIVERLNLGKEYWKLYYHKPIHVVVSPQNKAYYGDKTEYDKARHKAEQLAKKSGVLGGVMIFHHKRMPNEDHPLENSAHWHIIGYGWLENTDKIYKETGWIIKNLGVRKSLRETTVYILSHCSLGRRKMALSDGMLPMRKGTVLTTVWFGILAYNKMEKEEKKGDRMIYCKFCKKEVLESETYRILPYNTNAEYGLLKEIEYIDYIPDRLRMST